MKPQKFSSLSMYGDQTFFRNMLDAGFTEVALGSGQWVVAGDHPANQIPGAPSRGLPQRIPACFVFYNNIDGGRTLLGNKKLDHDGHSVQMGQAHEVFASQADLEIFLTSWKITLDPVRSDLKAVLNAWEAD